MVMERNCKVCNFLCRNEKELEIHEKTDKHLKKLSGEYLNTFCNVLKLTLKNILFK
jgi:uncharacterized protein YnzC (UPF0291/DUF896 family)